MNYLALPVSGGAFPHQVAIVSLLAELGYKPDITMGASGGNIVGYIAAAADWNANSIIRNAKLVTSNLFIKKWPTYFHSYFKASLYDRPNLSEKIFGQLFDETSIAKYEIWTGVCHLKEKKLQLFCNREREKTMYDVRIDYKKLGCLEPIYLSRDIKRCALVSEASAAIPIVVPPIEIDKQLYVDGGVCAASPLTVMADGISSDFHLTYVSSSDIETKEDNIGAIYSNIVRVGRNSLSNLVSSLSYRDRCRGVDLLKEGAKDKCWHVDCSGSLKTMKLIEELRKKASSSFVEYYPESTKILNLSDFNGDDVVELVEKTRTKFNCRIWWVGQQNLFSCLS